MQKYKSIPYCSFSKANLVSGNYHKKSALPSAMINWPDCCDNCLTNAVICYSSAFLLYILSPFVMALFVAFLFPKLLLAGAKDRNGFIVTKPGGCSFCSRGLLASRKQALCIAVCTAGLWKACSPVPNFSNRNYIFSSPLLPE